SGGAFKGRLKYNIVDASPAGLAVDNSTAVTQGRVYVTSGNTEQAGVYAYPPGAATNVTLPAAFSLSLKGGGEGAGTIFASLGGVACAADCTTEIRAGAQVTLSAVAKEGSAFLGWSGGDCVGTGPCEVTMREATSVTARFVADPPPSAPAQNVAPE